MQPICRVTHTQQQLIYILFPFFVEYATIGITTPELLMAHILTQSVIVFLQCTEVIFFIGVVFGTVNNGDNLTVIVLLSLTGFAGMLFGTYEHFRLLFESDTVCNCARMN